MSRKIIIRRDRVKYSLLVVGYIFFSTILSGCGPSMTVAPLAPEDLQRPDVRAYHLEQDYRIFPGDTLRIYYPFHAEMEQEVIVQPDGQIDATLIGSVHVAGLTTKEVGRFLIEGTAEYLRDPQIVVSVTRYVEKNVYVAGEVDRPGAILYRPGLSPIQAVFAAGGFLETAKTDSVILIRAVDGNELMTRRIDLRSIIHGKNKPITLALAPHDVLFVPKTPIANAGLWVEQHITKIFPFMRGVGANYRLN